MLPAPSFLTPLFVFFFLPPPHNVFHTLPHRRPPPKTHPLLLFLLFLNPAALSSLVRRFFFSRERERERGAAPLFFPFFPCFVFLLLPRPSDTQTHAHTLRSTRPAACVSVCPRRRRRRPSPRRAVLFHFCTPPPFFRPPTPPPPSFPFFAISRPRFPAVSDSHATKHKKTQKERERRGGGTRVMRERGERETHTKRTPVAHTTITTTNHPARFCPPSSRRGRRGEREREGLFCVYFFQRARAKPTL